jgi:tetratricopeptide (TPR) repeat protein
VSPGKAPDYGSDASSIIALVRAGRSLSGHERKCCFLNLQQGKFANISAISGVDFPDDGRGIGVADFDLDGDLDLWMVNRSAPQVRLLRNDSPPGHHYLALKLEGVKCNRDAIGARVEVRLRGDAHAPLMKTMRAGESFLSQNSKWLHFGLGTTTEIESVVVRWPSGTAEEFRGLQPDRRYRLVQGSGAAPGGTAQGGQTKPWEPPPALATRAPLKPAICEAPKSTPRRTFLGKRFPLPKLRYHAWSGSATPLAAPKGQPVLLVLWASWCGPCAQELKGLQARQTDLAAAGLNVLALSVDGLADDRTSQDEAKAFIQREKFTLPAGMATADLVDTLQVYLDSLFARDMAIGVPYSFLVDSQGQLAAIYRGAVDLQEVLADQKQLALSGPALRNAGVPFKGRWIDMPDYDSLLRITGRLVEEDLDNELEFVNAVKERTRTNNGYSQFVHHLIDRLLGQGRFNDADTWCQEALRINPKSGAAHHKLGIAHFNRNRAAEAVASFRRAADLSPRNLTALKTVTWVLATSPDPKVHNGQDAVVFAKRMFAAAGKNLDASMFDVAAAAYARAGRYEDAIKVLDQGIARVREARGVQLQAKMEERRDLYQRGQPLTQALLPELSGDSDESN